MLVLNTDIFSTIFYQLTIITVRPVSSFGQLINCHVTLYIHCIFCDLIVVITSLWWKNRYQYCLKRGVTPLPLDKLTFHDSYFRPHDNCKMMTPPPIKKLVPFQPNGFIVSETS